MRCMSSLVPRCGDQGLGFTASEDGGAVGAGRTPTSIDISRIWSKARRRATFLFDYGVAEDSFAHGFVVGLEFGLGGFIFFWQGGDQDFLKISDQA